MITTYLDAIEKLRENRERSALAELRASNTARDNATKAANRFESYLRSQTAAHMASEARQYRETLGKPLAPQELETIYSRIQRERTEIEKLAQQCNELKETASKAASIAEQARARHMRLHRAQKKWAKIREHHAEKMQIEEVYREELFSEEVKLPDSGF